MSCGRPPGSILDAPLSGSSPLDGRLARCVVAELILDCQRRPVAEILVDLVAHLVNVALGEEPLPEGVEQVLCCAECWQRPLRDQLRGAGCHQQSAISNQQ